MYASVAPGIGVFGYEAAFDHGSGVGEVQLENVAAGFYVEADGERIFKFRS